MCTGFAVAPRAAEVLAIGQNKVKREKALNSGCGTLHWASWNISHVDNEGLLYTFPPEIPQNHFAQP
jgi:hypothetical protein